MWFKEKLKLLQGAELEFYPLVTQLNEERANTPKVEVEVIEDKSKAKKPAKKTVGKAAKKSDK